MIRFTYWTCNGHICCIAIAVLAAGIVISYGILRAASVLHSEMLARILCAPASFFDTTPTGRIVNRFSKDVDTCDMTLPQGVRDFIIVFLRVSITSKNDK